MGIALRSFNPRTRTGCDARSAARITTGTRFNPRTRTGCDPSAVLSSPFLGHVSTHAPARGATRCDVPHLGIRHVSTHAPARGATLTARDRHGVLMFQPTHPHGVRRAEASGRRWLGWGFNPRTRTGCDMVARKRKADITIVSTHAPARGATRFRVFPNPV